MGKINLFEIKKNSTNFPKIKIKSSKESFDFLRQFYGDDITVFESFFILLLNANNTTIGYAKISQGGIVSTVVDVRIIAKYVVDSLATAVILAHNHPSGNLQPSEQDKNITKRIIECLSLFDCKVLDHIILTEDSYYSFSDNGII